MFRRNAVGIVLGGFMAMNLVFLALPARADFTVGSTAGPDLGQQYPAASGETSGDIRVAIAYIVQLSLGVLGILATVLIVYAGFIWMTASGNDEKIETSKKIMYASVIGLAIILSAYSITLFVTHSLINASAAIEPTIF